MRSERNEIDAPVRTRDVRLAASGASLRRFILSFAGPYHGLIVLILLLLFGIP